MQRNCPPLLDSQWSPPNVTHDVLLYEVSYQKKKGNFTGYLKTITPSDVFEKYFNQIAVTTLCGLDKIMMKYLFSEFKVRWTITHSTQLIQI